MTFAPCPECNMRPRYLVDGKWLTLAKIKLLRYPPSRISVHPVHRRWCPERYRYYPPPARA